MSDVRNSRGVPKTYKRHSWSKIIDTMVGSSVANADLLVRTGGVWARKAVGSAGQYLKSVAGVPTWSTIDDSDDGILSTQWVRQTTNHTVSNATTGTTFVNTELILTLTPGTYWFEVKNLVFNNATPDMKTQLNFTGTLSEIQYVDSFIIEGNTSYFNGEETAFNVLAVLTSSAHHTCTYRGSFKVTVTGDFSWQGAQNTSSATAITIAQIGGYMMVWQIA